MNDIARKWTTALRSGQYSQVMGSLRTDAGYCCLGVLCDLYTKETEKGAWSRLNSGVYQYSINDTEILEGYLPSSVVSWAKLYDPNPIGNGYSLAGLNDAGLLFEEIANQIEKDHTILFKD